MITRMTFLHKRPVLCVEFFHSCLCVVLAIAAAAAAVVDFAALNVFIVFSFLLTFINIIRSYAFSELLNLLTFFFISQLMEHFPKKRGQF